jgi:AraC family transcriptional regulator, transcriptional activator of the genes for pyochelin and ferripyochelin receptors
MATWIDQSELVRQAQLRSGREILRDLYGEGSPGQAGRIEFLPVEEGFFCSVNDWRAKAPTRDHTIVRNSIGLQFVKSGRVRQTLGGQSRYVHAGARVCLTTFPRETRQVRQYEAGLDVKYVGAWISPDVLVDRFGLEVDALPDPLKSFFRGQASAPFSLSLPMGPKLWMVLDEVFAAPFAGTLRQRYLEAKMVELMCETTASLGRLGAPSRSVEEGALSARESMLVQAAASIYARELADPPSVSALAARVGLNRNKLNAGFRALFGCTPHDYSKQVRMDWARRLLDEGALRQGEVAAAVGFRSPAAFSRAFADHFGIPPSASKRPSVTE